MAAGSSDERRLRPLASAEGLTVSRAAVMAEASSIGLTSRWSLPETMRETSRMSEMSWVWTRALRSMVSMARAAVAESSWPDRSMCVQPTIALKGVRSSWESVARNSSLARLAARACS